MKKEYIIYALLILGGVVFAEKIRALPVVGHVIPTI
jgi:hypothetical protein